MTTRRDLGTHSHHNSPNREKNKFLQLDVGRSLELSTHLMSTKGNGASCCFHPVLAGFLNPEQMRQNWAAPKYSLCPRSVPLSSALTSWKSKACRVCCSVEAYPACILTDARLCLGVRRGPVGDGGSSSPPPAPGCGRSMELPPPQCLARGKPPWPGNVRQASRNLASKAEPQPAQVSVFLPVKWI